MVAALATVRNQILAVRSGLNGMLDIARRTYSELLFDLEGIILTIQRESAGLQIRCIYTAVRGFHLQVYKRGGKKSTNSWLPSSFINPTYGRNSVACTTRQLIRLNDRITLTVNEILRCSYEVTEGLVERMREHISCLYNLSETLATTDLLVSMASYCSLTPCVRPELTGVYALKDARHPQMDRDDAVEITPNDVYCSEEANFVLITGPNMGGKSTYLKTVAVIQVMAQGGFFVPAQYASIRIVRQIFSRISHNDDIMNHRSAFSLEMGDMAYILEHCCDTSLVILDELCRSTSTEEGQGLCHALCEHFIRSKAFVFLATHFLDLTNLDAMYPNVINYHLEKSDVVGGEGLEHKVKYGPYRGPLYGMELARLAMFPDTVVKRATAIASFLHAKHQKKQMTGQERELGIHRAGNRLLQIALYSKLPANRLREEVLALQKRYREQMASLETSHAE